jgi:hypothetical protein
LDIIYIDIYAIIASLTPSFLSIISSLKQHHIPTILYESTSTPPSQLVGKDHYFSRHSDKSVSYSDFLMKTYTYFLHHHQKFHGTPHTWSIYSLSAHQNHLLFTQSFVPLVFPSWHRSLFTPHDGINSPAFQRLFILLDRSRSGSITFADFFHATITFTFQSCLIERLKLAFLFCDIDGDGIISPQDLSFSLVLLYRLYFGATYTTFEQYMSTRFDIFDHSNVSLPYPLWPFEENLTTAPSKSHFGHHTDYTHRIIARNGFNHIINEQQQTANRTLFPYLNTTVSAAAAAATSSSPSTSLPQSSNSTNYNTISHLQHHQRNGMMANSTILNVAVYTARLIYQMYKNTHGNSTHLASTFTSPDLIFEPLPSNSSTGSILSHHLSTMLLPHSTRSNVLLAKHKQPKLQKQQSVLLSDQQSSQQFIPNPFIDLTLSHTRLLYPYPQNPTVTNSHNPPQRLQQQLTTYQRLSSPLDNNINNSNTNPHISNPIPLSIFTANNIDLTTLNNVSGIGSSIYLQQQSARQYNSILTSTLMNSGQTQNLSNAPTIAANNNAQFSLKLQPFYRPISTLIPTSIQMVKLTEQLQSMSRPFQSNYTPTAGITIGFTFHEFIHLASTHPLLALFFNLNVLQQMDQSTVSIQLSLSLEALYRSHHDTQYTNSSSSMSRHRSGRFR